MDNYFLLFISPLVITFLFTPLIIRLAMRNGVVDEPNERKVHKHTKPLMGGFALYLAILISVLIFYNFSVQLTALLMSITLIVLIGIVDDFNNMRPLVKLFGQIAAAVILVTLSNPSFEPVLAFLDNYLGLRILSYLVIIVWIVAITNAFNLIDGLDGLATGSAIIVGGFLAIVSLIYGNYWAMGISLILVGSCLGFYPYNFQPARIFLGDTGSMMLGFSLAAVFLFNVQYNVSFSILFGGIFLFIYPVVDMVYAILRRIKSHSPIFKADRAHIHHQILDAGLSVRYVVYIIYSVSFIIGSFGIIIIRFPFWQVYLILTFATILIVFGIIISRRRSILHRQTPPTTTHNQ